MDYTTLIATAKTQRGLLTYYKANGRIILVYDTDENRTYALNEIIRQFSGKVETMTENTSTVYNIICYIP